MITFNSLEEANNFKDWVNANCAMLPIVTTEPIEQNNKWGFEETELLLDYYNKYNV